MLVFYLINIIIIMWFLFTISSDVMLSKELIIYSFCSYDLPKVAYQIVLKAQICIQGPGIIETQQVACMTRFICVNCIIFKY